MLNLGSSSSLGAGLDFVPGAGDSGGGTWGSLPSVIGGALSGNIPSLIAGGASLLGGFLGRSSSSKQNLQAMAFQQAQNDVARENVNYWNERNIDFARESRDFQANWNERMANTAHQRQIADLKAAGINPILTAHGGSGAASPPVSAVSAQVHGAGSAGGTPHLEPKKYADLGGAVQSAFAAKEKLAMLEQIEALTEKEKSSSLLISEQARTEVDRRVNLRADTELKGVEGKEREARIGEIRAQEEKLLRENWLGEKYGEDRYLAQTGEIKAATRSAEASASLHTVNASLGRLEEQLYKENPNLKEMEHYIGLIQKAVGALVGGALGGAAAARGMGRNTPPNTRTPFGRR